MLPVAVYTSRNPLLLILTLAMAVTYFVYKPHMQNGKKKETRKTDK